MNCLGLTLPIVFATNVLSEIRLLVYPFPSIPFCLHDDDDDTILPNTLYLNDLQETDIQTQNRFAQLYIRPRYDGGGSLDNNSSNVPFVRNTESSNTYDWNSRNNNSRSFWVVYLLAAFQDSFNNLTADSDSDYESITSITLASANNQPMESGVLIYLETIRDRNISLSSQARTIVHEIGHNFGLSDLYGPENEDGIMHHGISNNPSAYYFWRNADIDSIRNCTSPQ